MHFHVAEKTFLVGNIIYWDLHVPLSTETTCASVRIWYACGSLDMSWRKGNKSSKGMSNKWPIQDKWKIMFISMQICLFPIPSCISIVYMSVFPSLDWVFRDWQLFLSCSVPKRKDFPSCRLAILASLFHLERPSQHHHFNHSFQAPQLPSVLPCPLHNALISLGFPFSFSIRMTLTTSLLSFSLFTPVSQP